MPDLFYKKVRYKYNCSMKTTLICTDTLRSAKIAIDKKLTLLCPTDLDAKNFVVVPDRSTLDAERALLNTLGGSFNTQVVTFKNLANRLVNTPLNYLNKQNGVLLLSKLAFEASEQFVCFSKSFDTDGFAEKLYELISAFKYSRVSPEALSAQDLPVALKNKLQDVRLLYGLYVDATKDKFIDSADTLDLLADCLNSQTIGNWGFYIYDFLSFTEQEKRILEKLIQNGREVTVATPAFVDAQKTKSALFDNSVALAVKNVCQKLGEEFKQEYFCAPKSPLSAQVFNAFFGGGKIEKKPAQNDQLVLRVTADANGEAKSLAEFIDAYVKNGGLYGDVKVVCSDVSQYSYAIFKCFGDYEIPFYLDAKTSLADTLPARYALSFLQSHLHNHQLDKVLEFAKNPLFDQNLSAFETFCKKYNVNYRYDKFDIGCKDVLFESADLTRAKIQEYLCAEEVPKVATAEYYVDLITQLFEKHNLEEKISTHAEKLRFYGQEHDSKALLQAQKKIFGVLEQVKIIFGSQPLALDRFVVGLTSSLGSQTISVLPTKTDCVFVSNLDKGKNHDVKVLAVLGANEGELPKLYKSCALLSDKNLSQLSERGLSIDISLAQKNRQEKFTLYNLLCEPQKTLYISYKTKSQKDELRPSSVVSLIKKAFKIEENTFSPFAVSKKTAQDEAVLALGCVNDGIPLSKEQAVCLSLFGQSLTKYRCFKPHIDDIKNGDKLFFKGDTFSVTRIEKFFECPFWHFLQNGIGLKELEVADLNSSDFGNILHAVFQRFVNKIIKGQKVDGDTAGKIFDDLMQEERYKAIVKTHKGRAFCLKLKKEAVFHCQQIKKEIDNSDFAPFATEFVFDKHNNASPSIVVGDKRLYLKGIADRIDVCGEKALIYDYKSGKPTFSEAQLFNGTKLQLFVYALAVKKALAKKPIGSVYYKVKNLGSTDKKSKIIGRIIKDVDILKKIDNTAGAGCAGDLLGACITKSGEVNKKPSTFVDAETFEDYQAYAEQIITKACELMQRGYVDVNPLNDACTYCPAKNVCGFFDTRVKPARSVSGVTGETVSRVAKEQKDG